MKKISENKLAYLVEYEEESQPGMYVLVFAIFDLHDDGGVGGPLLQKNALNQKRLGLLHDLKV